MMTEARKKQLESAGKNLLITVGILCLCFGACHHRNGDAGIHDL